MAEEENANPEPTPPPQPQTPPSAPNKTVVPFTASKPQTLADPSASKMPAGVDSKPEDTTD